MANAKLNTTQTSQRQLFTSVGGDGKPPPPPNADYLQQLDRNLRIIVFIKVASLLLQTICGFVLGFIFPGRFEFLQIAFASEGIFMIFNGSALVYQMSRVIGCIISSTMEPLAKEKVVHKIRSQQYHFFAIALAGTCINLLLVIEIIPSVWYMLLYWIVIETLVSSFALIELAGRVCFSRQRRRVDEGDDLKSSAKPFHRPSEFFASFANPAREPSAGKEDEAMSAIPEHHQLASLPSSSDDTT